MTELDWIIASFIAVGAILGFVKGFVRQLASIVGLVVGLLVARALFTVVGERIAEELNTSVTFGQVVAFVFIWILIPVGFSIIASILTKAIKAVHLGFVNRCLGAGLGIVKYVLLASVLIHFIEFVDSKDALIRSTIKKNSLLYYPMRDFSGIFIPAIKDLTKQLIETDIYARRTQ